MKRAILVAAGTAVGLAAVLVLNPKDEQLLIGAGAAGAATAGGGSAGGSGTTGGGATPAPSGTPTPSGSSGAGASTAGSRTAQGQAVDARYGYVQVQATVLDGKITDVQNLQLPNNDGRSAYISQVAGPMLVQQALSAQSANVNGVSGATYTSQAFAQSLASALQQLGK